MPEGSSPTCSNCGAPLQLDAQRRCAFCHAPAPAAAADRPVPVNQILLALDALRDQPAVARFIEKQDLGGGADVVAAAVEAAGWRIVDSGVGVGSTVDIKAYTPVDLWTFNLAADLVAMLDAVDNLSKVTRAEVRAVLAGIDAVLFSPWSMSTTARGRPGPDELQPLRAAVPRRHRAHV